MCNLYSMTAAREAVLRLFRLQHNRAAQVPTSTAIFPGHTAAVVRTAEDGERELVGMSWGFVLPQQGKAPRRVTNARDDKVRSSAFWRDSFSVRRCLVPATAFAEPREVTPATWHWFALAGEEPRPLFAFAGLWRRWHGPVRKDGPVVDLDVTAFMTTTPNALVATINHERMPVLLDTPETQEAWLRGSADEAFALIREHPPERMRMVQSGFEKEDRLGADGATTATAQSLFD
jgi:putative SOS response-associated peptidase YedK